MMSKKKEVCVVGAGVSGLASACELRREGHDVTVMEQNGDIGGQWLYNPGTDGGDPLGTAGVHSSMYASGRLISPREAMGFSDFPFYPKSDGTGDARRFPCHGEFLRYIRDFCDAFGLLDVVKLKTRVVHVGTAPPGGDDDDGTMRWVVRCSRHGENFEGEVLTEEVFDAVVVAVGALSNPMLPTINGMDRWGRRQLHSHSYRVADSFQDEVVVIVGCHASGMDITLEICSVAKEVHISVKSMDGVWPCVSKMLSRHHNLYLWPQIDCLCEDGQVVFVDGSSIVADAIIYCTGHHIQWPGMTTLSRSWTRADWSPSTTAASARCTSTPSHRPSHHHSPSWAFPRGCSCRGSTRCRRGGWRRYCRAGGHCRRRMRCCAQSRRTIAPGRQPACPSTSRITSSSTWTTATSSGRSTAASRGWRSGRRSSSVPPSDH